LSSVTDSIEPRDPDLAKLDMDVLENLCCNDDAPDIPGVLHFLAASRSRAGWSQRLLRRLRDQADADVSCEPSQWPEVVQVVTESFEL